MPKSESVSASAMITSDTVSKPNWVVVDNPRQHGHLHQPEADDDHRGNRRPLRAADGFFT
ncbi:Uncharacterised protein [Escherichia coli]|uniref:Uncharacterized protein n=1 Tax=Escherichia coli TaxID=562 RepID=A0A377D7R6_ECOLX|nr:Uncharacterised protein [Escherichia coli]